MTWRNCKVALDGTHHVLSDEPLYAERFDEVLKFHAPASLRCGDATKPGTSAQTDSRRTPTLPSHLRLLRGPSRGARSGRLAPHPSDGTDVYAARYAWCGNFQGGRCAVRDGTGTYFHLSTDGMPAYDSRWRYAGDFRDGIGVVQADDGRSTHIDLEGRPVHDQWFVDLDVFHKGFARARDEDGWTHVDEVGRPIYTRRFAAVEPFYNGQARVERFDGGLEVIDDSGQRVVELRAALRSEFAALSGDMVGFWRTQAICAAVELGLFEALPDSTEGIAERCALTPSRARRLLRALAEMRLVTLNDREWKATVRGEYLRSEHPLTLADAAMEYGRHFQRMWSALPDALRADGSWRAPDIFGEVAADAERTDGHHRMLMSYALHDYVAVPAALRLRGDERVVDAGGGLGALATMLVEQYPRLRVEIFERPEVVERASRKRLRGDIALRSGDICAPWAVEADVVVLARVLHDWDDRSAMEILRHARQALSVGGRLFVVEMLVPETGVAGSLCDLHLLMATGGAERTSSEYTRLIEEAGFDLVDVRRIPALPSIIEGVAR
jgi:hypothetical protein